MILEHGLFFALAVAIFFAVWGESTLWRIAGLKLALDSASISLLAFSGKAPVSGLRVLSLLVIVLGTTILFCSLVLAFQFFRAKLNE